ncbi:uncharacterized protein PRCAT00002487001 [Priceomyces carsonii]|uniref:uncharacterized protein n=1 Tax=Priceomyces carsonii TaxID=28549 RepID=UPI002EDA9268|nr:unnamed protein product [Priceomyces carsonii]
MGRFKSGIMFRQARTKVIDGALGTFSGGKKEIVSLETIELTGEDDTQNSNGAPVEKENPLGYNLDYFTAFYIIIQGVIGTGIFATPASVLSSIGSIGASYVLWVSGFIIALFEISVYIEFVTYFQRRSGGDVAYLEQSYPRPAFLVPTTYAAVSVLLSYMTSSAVAFGQYILSAADVEITTWRQRGIGVGVLTFVALAAGANTRISMKISSILGFMKMVFLLFIIITGFVVMGRGTSVTDSLANFKNAWEGTTRDGNAISNAILKVSFSYSGTQYLFCVVGESDPKKTKNMFRYFVPAVVFAILVIYLLVISSYYAGCGTVEEIKNSGTLIASLFFENVFGSKSAQKALSSLVAISALGHLFAAFVGHSRALRECGRQGVLPFSRHWTSTKPFGTPLLAIFATWIVNVIVLVAPPAGDAYNFIIDLSSYANYIFKLLLVVGLVLVRRERKAKGLGSAGWKVPLPILIITIFYEVFVIAMAWVPPADGTLKGSDVSFFYCTYAIVCIGILGLCVLYYFLWAKVFPRVWNYEHRVLYYELENGEKGHTVIKVDKSEVEDWDHEHDNDGKHIRDTELVLNEVELIETNKEKG